MLHLKSCPAPRRNPREQSYHLGCSSHGPASSLSEPCALST